VVACRLSFPWPLRGVLELAFEERGSEVAGLVPSAGDPVLWLGGAFVAIVLTQGLAELIQRVSFARFSIGLVHDARGEALERLARPGDSGAMSRDPGDLIARVIGDSARFKAGLKGILIRMTQNGTFVVGVCAMLLVIDLPLGLAFLGGTTLILIVAGFGATRVNRISQRLRKKEGKLANHMHAVLSGQEGELADLEASERQAGHAEAKTTKLEGLVIWGVHALLALTTCSVLVLGLQGVRSGRLAAADLFTVLFYLLLVHNPTVRFGRQAVRVGRVLASAERLVKIMDGPSRVRAAGPGVAAVPRAPRSTEPPDSRRRQSHERAAGPVR
jgi:ABC-type multidrug transport system fused ATPase/permease subunit